MAKSQKQQHKLQSQQKIQKHFRIYSTSSLLLCGLTILLFGGIASGNGNINAAGNHNYTMLVYPHPTEQRSKRGLATTDTEVQQSTLFPNANGDPEDINENKEALISESINLKQNYDNPFRELNITKRAPNGFVGMRGKKHFSDDEENDDYNSYAMDLDINPLYKTKAANTDDIEYDYIEGTPYGNSARYKKAPTTFYGVRGKKLPNHESIGYNNRLNGMMRKLQQEQIREKVLEDFIGRLALATAEQNEIIKRTPTGFMGLRGKRPAYDWNTRKWQLNNENALLAAEETMEKRAPTNAFVGVRGKKDVDNQSETEKEHQNLFKRSPSESFAGSGKRRYGEFSNKFVAVRGKKDITSSAEAASYNLRQRLRYLVNSMPDLVYGSRLGGDINSFKRAPNGFVGMRGKRSANVAHEEIF